LRSSVLIQITHIENKDNLPWHENWIVDALVQARVMPKWKKGKLSMKTAIRSSVRLTSADKASKRNQQGGPTLKTPAHRPKFKRPETLLSESLNSNIYIGADNLMTFIGGAHVSGSGDLLWYR
jgi:hypothetical protein